MMLVMFSLREWRKAEVDVKACWFCKERRSCALSCKNTLWFSQVLISNILQVEMVALLWGEPALTGHRNTFEFASVCCPANLIENVEQCIGIEYSSIESVLFCQSLLPFFSRRDCGSVCGKSWGLRQEACSALITTPDKRPALCYKLFLKELNQAWNNYKHETQECNRLPICSSLQRGIYRDHCVKGQDEPTVFAE